MVPWPTHLVHDADDQLASHAGISAAALAGSGPRAVSCVLGGTALMRMIKCRAGADNILFSRTRPFKSLLQKRGRQTSAAHARLPRLHAPPARPTTARGVPRVQTSASTHAMTGSVVTVQLGQCGNQVGAELFDTLSTEIDAHPSRDRAGIRRAFFREPHRDDDSDAGFNSDDVASTSSRKTPVARAVLIDMEPKVVQASVRRARKTGRWRYDGDRTLAFQSGSGNNWARGYHTYGELVRDEVLDLVRAEAEACDHMGGFMLMQSMAGGEFLIVFERLYLRTYGQCE